MIRMYIFSCNGFIYAMPYSCSRLLKASFFLISCFIVFLATRWNANVNVLICGVLLMLILMGFTHIMFGEFIL